MVLLKRQNPGKIQLLKSRNYEKLALIKLKTDHNQRKNFCSLDQEETKRDVLRSSCGRSKRIFHSDATIYVHASHIKEEVDPGGD